MFNVQQIHRSEGNPHPNMFVKVIFDDDFNKYTKHTLHSYFLDKISECHFNDRNHLSVGFLVTKVTFGMKWQT